MTTRIPSLLTVHEIQILLGQRLKDLRLLAGFKRETLARRSGVSMGSLKRFEATGEVSLKNLLRLALALGRAPEFAALLKMPEATSLSDLEDRSTKPTPKRGKI